MRCIPWLLIGVGALVTSVVAEGQTRASVYQRDGDKGAAPSILSFYNPVDGKTYVLNGDPASFAIPVTGTFEQGPLQYRRNGTATEAALDTGTPANNRPVPFTLLAGDALGPVAVGSGNTTASTLRFRLVDDQTLAVTCAACATESTLSTLSGKVPSGLTVSSTRLLVDGSGVTQPVSAASLPLPTGAATSALQTTGNTSLASIDAKNPALVSGRVPVDGSGVTQPVSGTVTAEIQVAGNPPDANYGTPSSGSLRTAAMLGVGSTAVSTTNPVPTDTRRIGGTAVEVGFGSATTGAQRVAAATQIGTAAASANSGTTDGATQRVVANIQRNGNELSYGNGGSDSNTQRVALANESRVTAGGAPVQLTSSGVLPFVRDMSSTSISTSYTEIVASLGAQVNKIVLANNSAGTFYLATGAAASEVVFYVISAGENVTIPVQIASGTRIAVRSLFGTVSDGIIAINAFQ
jgi:hypothetical protein